jgi:hypothetical protein
MFVRFSFRLDLSNCSCLSLTILQKCPIAGLGNSGREGEQRRASHKSLLIVSISRAGVGVFQASNIRIFIPDIVPLQTKGFMVRRFLYASLAKTPNRSYSAGIRSRDPKQ